MKAEMQSTVVYGGSVGSEGKGAVVGYLARRHAWAASICTFMTNAGHTWESDTGEKVVVQQLPMALVGPEVGMLLIAPGSAITLDQLEKEINAFDKDYNVSDRLRIHPRAMIIEQQDVDYEKDGVTHLASTAKGCGAALARKAMRKQDVKLARDVAWLKPFLADTTELVNDFINDGLSVIVEGSQGFDLDINHGIEYPYTTSRGTTPMQTMADCGIDARQIPNVLAVLRTYPIRVGNVEGGTSGPFGGKELTWEEITKRSGSKTPLAEYTTVTKRLRRIFEMDFNRLRYMAKVCRPNQVALTFADYVDAGISGQAFDARDSGEGWAKLPETVRDFVMAVEGATEGHDYECRVTMLKTGPKDSHVIEV